MIPEFIELLDALLMKAITNYGMTKRKRPEKDSVFFKFKGPSNPSLNGRKTRWFRIFILME